MPYKDKEKQKKFQAKWRRAKNKLMRDILWKHKDVPCMDCNIKYPPYVMDFDHREGEEKVMGVGALVTRASADRILAEIAKCDVVCSNCHRERTYQRIEHKENL